MRNEGHAWTYFILAIYDEARNDNICHQLHVVMYVYIHELSERSDISYKLTSTSCLNSWVS